MTPNKAFPKILALATQGKGGNDEQRLQYLLSNFQTTFLPFESGTFLKKFQSFLKIIRTVFQERPDLVVMEGTGIFGGLGLIICRILFSTSYLVSSGDAVSAYIGSRVKGLRPFFFIYEYFLYKLSKGFIGWSPYLVGRALTLGSPKAMVASGWSEPPLCPTELQESRLKIRQQLNIRNEAIVVGIVGSIAWNRRYEYCYGLELVKALILSQRQDIHVLIVGDGTGQQNLGILAGSLLNQRIHLVGAVPRKEVAHYLAAMDVASLPQSVDAVGSFRYTTKLSEYLASKLPIVTSQIPLAYDLDQGWIWRIPGHAPWAQDFIVQLARWMDSLSREDIKKRKTSIPSKVSEFDSEIQKKRVTSFIQEL